MSKNAFAGAFKMGRPNIWLHTDPTAKFSTKLFDYETREKNTDDLLEFYKTCSITNLHMHDKFMVIGPIVLSSKTKNVLP